MNSPKGFHFKWVYEAANLEVVTSTLHSDSQDMDLPHLVDLFRQFLRGCEYSDRLVERIVFVDEDWS